MNRRIIYVLGLLACIHAGTAAAQEDVNRLIVFGDSLSDPGNYFTVFGDQSLQPYEPDNIPSAPYPIGGHHFSNGKTWVEQLSHGLQIPTDGMPALLQPGRFTNYAVGRSRARVVTDGSVFDQYNLSTQVGDFLADFDNQAPADALYVMWIGSNDLSDALSAPDPAVIISASVANTITRIVALYYHGAREFLIPNLPDLAVTPAVRELAAAYPPPYDSMILNSATLASVGYNAALEGNLALLEASLPGIRILRMDVFSILHEVIADPAAAGFSVVDHACITPAVQGGAHCSNPNDYLFWDGIHPTAEGHRYLADRAAAILDARP